MVPAALLRANEWGGCFAGCCGHTGAGAPCSLAVSRGSRRSCRRRCCRWRWPGARRARAACAAAAGQRPLRCAGGRLPAALLVQEPGVSRAHAGAQAHRAGRVGHGRRVLLLERLAAGVVGVGVPLQPQLVVVGAPFGPLPPPVLRTTHHTAQGWWLLHACPAQHPAWRLRHAAGLALWLAGWAGNLQADGILRRLRSRLSDTGDALCATRGCAPTHSSGCPADHTTTPHHTAAHAAPHTHTTRRCHQQATRWRAAACLSLCPRPTTPQSAWSGPAGRSPPRRHPAPPPLRRLRLQTWLRARTRTTPGTKLRLGPATRRTGAP
jgi:hypothetical protein